MEVESDPQSGGEHVHREFGEPLTGVYSIPDGQARLYERGATINGSGGEIVVTFNLPMIGVPQIAVGNPGTATPLEPRAVTFQTGSWDVAALRPVIDSAFAGRLALLPPVSRRTRCGSHLGPPKW